MAQNSPFDALLPTPTVPVEDETLDAASTVPGVPTRGPQPSTLSDQGNRRRVPAYALCKAWTSRPKHKRRRNGGNGGSVWAYVCKTAEWVHLPGCPVGAEPTELTITGQTSKIGSRQPTAFVLSATQRHERWGWQGRLVWACPQHSTATANTAITHLQNLGLQSEAIACVIQPVTMHLIAQLGPGASPARIRGKLSELTVDNLARVIYRAESSWENRDSWAAPLKIAADHPERLRALAVALLESVSAYTGSTSLALRDLLQPRGKDSRAVLQSAPTIDSITVGLGLAVSDGSAAQLTRASGEARYAVATVAQTERQFCELVAKLNAQKTAAISGLLDRVCSDAELSPIQAAEVGKVLGPESSRVGALTGYAGSGKTTCTRAIMDTLVASGVQVLGCAPTGRAAVRLKEVTGYEAATVHSWHRRLEQAVQGDGEDEPQDSNRDTEAALGGGFELDLEKPVAIVVDEASMISTEHLRLLLEIIDNVILVGLYFVGDDAQLPPIAPGFPFFDLLANEAIPVGILTENHRASRGKGIAEVGRLIRDGVLPKTLFDAGGHEGDLWFGAIDDPSQTLRIVVDLAVQRPDDIQVLVPQHKGPIGGENLNKWLQLEILQKRGLGESLAVIEAEEGVRIGGNAQIAYGDRVQATVNDWDVDIANGEVGEVIVADPDGMTLADATARLDRPLQLAYKDEAAGYNPEVTKAASGLGAALLAAQSVQVFAVVDFGDGRCLAYHERALWKLRLAYAITIHAAQGGEWPIVVTLCDRRHQPWSAQRELIYTACTRASEGLYVVGQWSAMGAAVAGITSNKRTTVLHELLNGASLASPNEQPNMTTKIAKSSAAEVSPTTLTEAQTDDPKVVDGVEIPF